ncbi:hypothetical protein Forpe1208_v000574 [Fusarium oxysporum f. sp. rapae]|uniref:Uncharacterized protein n=1 Tax=Fusarium oxysporum f. sp. rapae TaxID=485398 RepID=A0A8J5PMK8_FUSOX|nr:hypothetical protein Forpe1208_v000574 [Fusarium oxysporum f. sp. rapae]
MTMRSLALGQNNQRNRVSYVAVDTRSRNWNHICISYPDYWALHRHPREQRACTYGPAKGSERRPSASALASTLTPRPANISVAKCYSATATAAATQHLH